MRVLLQYSRKYYRKYLDNGYMKVNRPKSIVGVLLLLDYRKCKSKNVQKPIVIYQFLSCEFSLVPLSLRVIALC